ncbi:MAG: tRNA 2-thiouridine(34) synthase MnmA [Patescibacteria group bacterium]
MDKKEKIFVGLSGGVDSSVSAGLLKEGGYDVTGVFIKVWQPSFLECTWIEDRRDAMRVCAKLDIPFKTLDLEEEYKKEVAEYMINEYKAGRTPNPDVMCNKEIKFGAFMNKALSLGAHCIATGHYAKTDGEKLFVGADKNKDQSYFLWTLRKEKLAKIKFPIGDYQKSEVRKLAKKFGLPTSEKKDSQGLCFLGKLDIKDFLKHYLPEKTGNVLSDGGEVIGKHDGTYFYTLGQRHGFSTIKQKSSEKPLYIISKNIEKNTITVSENPIDERQTTSVKLHSINWIRRPELGKEYKARVRYRQELKECRILEDEDGTFVQFDEKGIYPSGQSVVVYDEDECLGGGIIE